MKTEKEKQYQKKWAEKNKEYLKIYRKEYRKKNLEKVRKRAREIQRIWYANHKEIAGERQRNWIKNNPEKWKKFRDKYRKKLKEQGIGISDGSLYGRPKKELLKLWNYQCAICNSKDKLVVHHIDKKGSNVFAENKNNKLENLIILCPKCHYWIHIPDRTKRLKEKGLWSQKGIPKCLNCGTITKKHSSKGLCLKCYEKTRREYKADYYRKHYAIDRTLYIA